MGIDTKMLREALDTKEEIWEEFIQWWMKRNQEQVVELIGRYLEEKVDKTYTDEADEYARFLDEKIQEEIGTLADKARMEQKDIRGKRTER